MYEKLYLLQLNESFQRCEGFLLNYWWAQIATI